MSANSLELGRTSSRKRNPYRHVPAWFLRATKRIPLVRRLIFSKPNQHRCPKMAVGLGLGLLAAWLVNYFVIQDLPLPDDALAAFKLTIYLVSGTLNASVARCRCVTLLILPQMMTTSGLKFIKSSLLAAVLAGPVANILFNSKSVIDSIACTAGLVRNLSTVRYTLTFQPFQRALMTLKSSSVEVDQALSSIQEVVGPLLNEFLNDDETKYAKEYNDYLDVIFNDSLRSHVLEAKFSSKIKMLESAGCEMSVDDAESEEIEHFYTRKLEYRCQNLISAAEFKCRQIFDLTQTVCQNILPFFLSSLLCWPSKLSYICNTDIVMAEEIECDPDLHLSRGWGRGMAVLMKTKQALTKAVSVPTVFYVVESPKVMDTEGIPSVLVDARWDLERNSRWILKIFKIIEIFVAVSFFHLVFDTAKYHSRFVHEIDFDNIYISQSFKKIDARRYAAGKHNILPLKNRERSYFVLPTKLYFQKIEAAQMEYELFNLVPMFFVVTAVVLIDRAFVEALDIVSRNARFEPRVPEKSKDTVIRVRGTGVLAKVVRSIVRQFNAQRRSSDIPSNVNCLPRARLLRIPQLFHLYSILFVCALVVVLGSYGRRWRWAQLSFFYPRWAKTRSLFLYNDILKKRKIFYKYRNSQIKRLAFENKLNQDASLLLLLRFKYPNALGWLAYICRRARRRCLICLYVEDEGCFNLNASFVECSGCLYIYCEECWADIGYLCPVCNFFHEEEDLPSVSGSSSITSAGSE